MNTATRNQLRALRSRFPRSATGGIPPAVSPKLQEVHDKLSTFHAMDPARARVRSPHKDKAQAQADEAGEEGGQGRGKQINDGSAGSNDGERARRGATSVGEVSSATVYENTNQIEGGTQRLDGVLFENGGCTGEEKGREDMATIMGDMTVEVEEIVACRVGHGDSDGETSTRSRPSELFDSLDLCVT